MAEPAALGVSLHGRAIATLTSLPGERTLLVFESSYLDDPERHTLSLSFKGTSGEPLTEIRPTRVRVPPFFSNLLPEGALRTYLARRTGVRSKREFPLLRALGHDLPGAVTIAPIGLAHASAGESSASALPRTPNTAPLRFSLAGVQLKLSALMEASGGLTVPAEGIGGDWIVKLPSATFSRVPENEFAMMELARAIGLSVPEVRLIALDAIAGMPDDLVRHLDGSALAVRRFDRGAAGTPVHTEDFAQVFGLYPERKYERASYRNVAEVLLAETGREGVAEFVRRLVFNALIGNADMHLKNWSLIYPDGRRAALAPAYDLVSTIAYIDDTDMALTFGRSKRMTDLSLGQLDHFAAKAGLSRMLVRDAASTTVRRFVETWQGGRAVRDVAPHTVEPIERLLAHVPLLGELTAGDPHR